MESGYITSSADLLGLIIIGFLVYLIKRSKYIQNGRTRYYLYAVYFTSLIIILEILSGLLDYYASPKLKAVSLVVNCLGFSFMFILPILVGMLYSDKVYRIRYRILLPVLCGVLFSVSSIWTGWGFTIDMYGRYMRGPFFGINIIITLYGFAVLLVAHFELTKEFDESEKGFLRLLYVIILATSLIQIVTVGQEIMWGGIAVFELLYYIFLSGVRLRYDAVTEVRNRNSFEQKMSEIQPDENLFLIEFDINNLKEVNDKYGHKKGDEYLKNSVNIIKKAYNECGVLYRIGGDEFVVIAQECTDNKVLEAREKMLAILHMQQQKFLVDYYIANAYCRYDKTKHLDVHSCLSEVDKKMYEDKALSKN